MKHLCYHFIKLKGCDVFMCSFIRKKLVLKKYVKTVEKINLFERKYAIYTNRELKARTAEFKSYLTIHNNNIHAIKAEAFAVVREAAKRILGMRHYDVQLLGGLALLDGKIAEMATGEGKSLVAALPSYLRALVGKGVHIITTNEYLAQRDYEKIGEIHRFLGLTVGLNLPGMSIEQKQKAYNADITYGIGSEFGFDYLRDHMVTETANIVQRPFYYAIIDEVDSILIDEAKTPLVIAGKSTPPVEQLQTTTHLINQLKEKEDYMIDHELQAAYFTKEGITKLEKALEIDHLYKLEHQSLYNNLLLALYAKAVFRKNVEYIVQANKIKLIDMNTGRVMEDRMLNNGLHQAIEAKEGLPISETNKTYASITIQHFFRMYPILSGMSGTATTEKREFRDIYGLQVLQIPTNKPVIRQDLPDKVFETIDMKYKAVTQETKKRHKIGQPILIGTTSVEQSHILANYLDEEGLPYELLNAVHAEKEAELIAKAGQKGKITIATNMAGRGTDITLGKGVSAIGGLHVIGTEKHESRRIDYQLKGRAGRQGDPGSSQFFISLEDELITRFASSEQIDKQRQKLKQNGNRMVENKKIAKWIDRIQKKCEAIHFSAREWTLKLDRITTEQRLVIFTLRNNILHSNHILSYIENMYKNTFDYYISVCCIGDHPSTWNYKMLTEKIATLSFLPAQTISEQIADHTNQIRKTASYYLKRTISHIEALWEQHPPLHEQIKKMLLTTIDYYWIQHLEAMEHLKEGIFLRAYGQEDPLNVYQREGYDIFLHTYRKIEIDVCQNITSIIKNETEEIENISQVNETIIL